MVNQVELIVRQQLLQGHALSCGDQLSNAAGMCSSGNGIDQLRKKAGRPAHIWLAAVTRSHDAKQYACKQTLRNCMIKSDAIHCRHCHPDRQSNVAYTLQGILNLQRNFKHVEEDENQQPF